MDINTLKVEHSEWYSATGTLGLKDYTIDAFGVKDTEMERQVVLTLDSETLNKLDNINRYDMKNWSDLDEEN